MPAGSNRSRQGEIQTERTAANYRMHEGNVITLPYYTGAEYYYKNKNEIATITSKGTNATSTEKFRKEELVRDNTDLAVTELTDVSVKSHKRSEATQKAFENFRDSVIIDVGTQNAIIEGLVERIEAVEEVQYTADVKPKQRKRKKI